MKYDIPQLQDDHLDMMIRLAFDLEDIEQADALLSTADPALTEDDVRLADAAYLLACARAEKASKPRAILAAARKALPWVINIAACIVLLLAIAAPVAIANSSTFRAKVMELIMELDEEKGEAHFSFVSVEDAAFDVPEGWRGNYFPSYIPNGFFIYDYDPAFPMACIQYRNEAEDQLFFDEFTSYTDMMVGTEDCTISPILINGNQGTLIQGPGADGITLGVTITWQNDTNWFCVTTFGLTTEEAIAVASSVKRITK